MFEERKLNQSDKQLKLKQINNSNGFHFEVESQDFLVKENEIDAYQTSNFLDNYERDIKWGTKRGTQGIVNKYVVKSNIQDANQPKAVIRKVLVLSNEDEKLEAEREIQAYINISLMKNKPPQILEYYGWEKADEDSYIIYMEFCEDNFEDIMVRRKKQNQQFTNKEIFNYFEQLLEGLLFLRSINLAHRDLKPENIFVKNGILKIGDFGKAKIGSSQNMLKSLATETTQGVGSMPFLAPEIAHLIWTQQQNCKYDIFAADMYSLGLIIASLLKNESIFESVSKLKGSLIKEVRKSEAYKIDKNDPKVLFQKLEPKHRLRGPHDKYLEKIIQKEIRIRNQSPEIQFLSICLSQMLSYNPLTRTTLINLKKQLILSKLTNQIDYSIQEYQLIINQQAQIFDKINHDYELFTKKLNKLTIQNKKFEQQIKELQQNLKTNFVTNSPITQEKINIQGKDKDIHQNIPKQKFVTKSDQTLIQLFDKNIDS